MASEFAQLNTCYTRRSHDRLNWHGDHITTEAQITNGVEKIKTRPVETKASGAMQGFIWGGFKLVKGSGGR